MRAVLTCTAVAAFVFTTAAAFSQTGGAGAGGGNSGGASGTGGTSGGVSSGTNTGTTSETGGAGGTSVGTSGTGGSSAAGRGGVSSNPGNAAGQVSGTPAGLSMGSEQARQVTDRLRSITIEPLSGVDFELRESLTVPQNVTMQDCPEELGKIVEALKSCQLIRIKDQFILVEPQTRKILEVIRVAS
jgi:hypothetical protein